MRRSSPKTARHATRTIHARLGESAEVQHTLVTYNLLVGSARDMHRLREEAAIRSLDTAAAAAHRAKKTELQREQRIEQQTGDDQAVVCRVLSRVIAQIECTLRSSLVSSVPSVGIYIYIASFGIASQSITY